ncbi:MAG: sulfur carrier protein ThiS [Thiomargarita sp.]|nr:sulfur carrier protein ThiS [Thiomargarita sp.]
MEIFINGKAQLIEDQLSITGLLKTLDLEQQRLAVEINLDIIPRSQFEHYVLSVGDKVEIVRAIGGG